jgi:hypothetical protein
VAVAGRRDLLLATRGRVGGLGQLVDLLDLDGRDDDLVCGRSWRPVGVVAMRSTTSRLAWSATSPKIVCFMFRCGVGPR